MVNNGTITAPVSIADVESVIGTANHDLRSLCRKSNINEWSLVKPMYCENDNLETSGFYYNLINVIDSSKKQLSGNHRTIKNISLAGVQYEYNLIYGVNIPCYEDQAERAKGYTSNNLMINPSFAARLLKRPERGVLFYRYANSQLVKYRLTDFNTYNHNTDPFFIVKLDFDELNDTIKNEYSALLSKDNMINSCKNYNLFKEINTLAINSITATLRSPYSLANFIKSLFIKDISDYQYYRAFVAFYCCNLNTSPSNYIGPGEAFWSSFAIRKNNQGVYDWSVTTGDYSTWTVSNNSSGNYPTTIYIFELDASSQINCTFPVLLASSGNTKYWELIPIFFIKENSEITTEQVYTNVFNTKINNVAVMQTNNGVTTPLGVSFTTSIATSDCCFPPVCLRRLIKSVSYINPSWFSNYKKNISARIQVWAGTNSNNVTYTDFQNLNKTIHQSDFNGYMNTAFGVQIYAYNYKYHADENSVNSDKPWYVCAPNVNTTPTGLRFTFLTLMSMEKDGENGVFVSFGKLAHSCYFSNSTMVIDTNMLRKWNATDMQFNICVPNHINFTSAYNTNKNSSDAVKASTSTSNPTDASLYTFPVDSIDLIFEIVSGTNVKYTGTLGGLGTFIVFAYTSIDIPGSVTDMEWLKTRQNTWFANDSVTSMLNRLHLYTNITEAVSMNIPN